MRHFLILVIRGYRLIFSPWMGSQCRFFPSCSVYTEDAVRAHGSLRGLGLGMRRIAKCHPWHPGGFDPVPPRTQPETHHG